MIYRSTKRYSNFPCTHRQWKAEGHCRFIHGYSREFSFEFACHERTRQGWIVDFGGLKKLKAWLDEMFDHTFLVSEDDPFLSTFKELNAQGVLQIRILPDVGMEGTAEYVFKEVNDMILDMTQNRAWLTKVEVRENEKNSAIIERDHLSSS